LGDKQLETGAKLDLTAFPPLLGNADVAGSSVVDDQMGQPALQIQFTDSAGTTFSEYTGSHIGSYFAIVMDGTVVSAPVINEGIPGGDVQISFVTGEADRTEIAQLAALIRFGPLPVPLVEVGGVPASSPG
jgi:preprotein translocase subunit SecD